MARRSHGFAATGLVATLALPTVALGAQGDALTIAARNVNVRAGPSLGTEAILQLDRGHQVVEVGRDGAWVNVELPDRDGRRGWIHGALVAPAAAKPAPAADRHRRPAEARGDGRLEVVEVQVRSANVRAGPALGSPVITWVYGGRPLPVLERSNDWVRVGLDGGQAGWIYGALVATAGARGARAGTPEAPPPEASGPAAIAPEEVRPAAEPTTAALGPEPVRPTTIEIETVPAPAPGRSDARLEILATIDDPHEQPSRTTPGVGRLERGRGTTEPERAEGRAEAAMTAPPATAPSPEGRAPDGGVVGVRAERVGLNDEKLYRFRTMVDRVNERVRRAVGVDVFAKVEDLGGGAVELTATDAWRAAPEAARRANLEALSHYWGAVHEPDVPTVVRIVDDRGEVMMEERRGGEPPAELERFAGALSHATPFPAAAIFGPSTASRATRQPNGSRW